MQPFGLLGFSAQGSGQAQRLIPWVPGGKKTLVRNCAFKRSMPLCLPCKQITKDSKSSYRYWLRRCAERRPPSFCPRIGCIGVSAHSNGGTWPCAFHDFGRGCRKVPLADLCAGSSAWPKLLEGSRRLVSTCPGYMTCLGDCATYLS